MSSFATILLDWYTEHARTLPWRSAPNASDVHPSPYHVWLSEIMLQQTTVPVVKGYYERFIKKWPDLPALAAAQEDDVLKLWAGLGYYARARNLLKCAQIVLHQHKGIFPNRTQDLLALPGIGPYTAAAIMAIAFDHPGAVVDGNVQRIIARLFCLETPLPDALPEITAKTQELTPLRRPGDFAQAMMDLAAQICRPRQPACSLCPVKQFCGAFAKNMVTEFPRKKQKPLKPVRYGFLFLLQNATTRHVVIRKRPDAGLLARMSEFPGTPWRSDAYSLTPEDMPPFMPPKTPLMFVETPLRHVFTHFHLVLTICRAYVPDGCILPEGHWWCPLETLQEQALPSVMKKACVFLKKNGE